MRDSCPFPYCVLEDFHEGDHDTGKPIGKLRELQTFVTDLMRCDLCPELPAKGMYQDERGRGWKLCKFCKEEFGALNEHHRDQPGKDIRASITAL